MIVDYAPTLDIRNLDALPRGTGAAFLLCLASHETGVLIAHSWKRRQPAAIPGGYVLVRFVNAT